MEKSKIYSINVTESCNLNCIYCYGGKKKPTNMSIQKAIEICNFILDDASKNNIKNMQVLFELGEPLLNFDIIKSIVLYLNTSKTKQVKRIDFTIFTNLQLMNKNTLNFLKKNQIHIAASLDGPKKIHNHQRGHTYDKTVYWINQLKKNIIPFELSTTVTKRSLGSHKEIIDLYINLGLQVINFRVLDKLGFGKKNWNSLGYSSKEFLSFKQKGLLYIIRKNFEGNFIIHSNFLFMFYFLKDKSKANLFSMPCNTFDKRLFFDSKGDIFTCGEGKTHENSNFFRIGNTTQGILLKKIKLFYDTLCSTKKFFCIKSKCEVYGICSPCLALNPQINVCSSDRCEILKNNLLFLNNLLKNKKIYDLFIKWSAHERQNRCLYK